MQSVKFLVVDDSPTIRRQVREFLEQLGHVETDVLTVTDAEHALELLHEVKDVGCVITGTKIPNLGGLGLVREIRASEAWCRLPILVMIEPDDDGSTITLARTLGSSGYIRKPVRLEVLRDKLAFVLAPRLVDAVS